VAFADLNSDGKLDVVATDAKRHVAVALGR
jgi:hypothetical protein